MFNTTVLQLFVFGYIILFKFSEYKPRYFHFGSISVTKFNT